MSYVKVALVKEEEKAADEVIKNTPSQALSEDVYGFVLASLIKDSADIHLDKLHGHKKRFRIFTACSLYFVMLGLQVFLLGCTKFLVSPLNVAEIRKTYGDFEAVMYTDDAGVQHTENSANGFPRGIDGFFNAKKFEDLTDDDKKMVCQIPLSKKTFLFVILWLWILTVLTQAKKAINVIVRVIGLDNIDVSAVVFDEATTDALDKYYMSRGLLNGTEGMLVTGLTKSMKFVIIFFIQLPRVTMSIFMAWLGSRWLTATVGFGDMMLNALALVFIFELAELMYGSVVPHNSKEMVEQTSLPHVKGDNEHSVPRMFGMFLLAFIAAGLAYGYMLVQQVLPDYKWDIAQVCSDYLGSLLDVQQHSLDDHGLRGRSGKGR